MKKKLGVKSQESRVRRKGIFNFLAHCSLLFALCSLLIASFLFIAFNASAQVLSGNEIMRVSCENLEGLVQEGRIEITERKISDIVIPEGSLTLVLNPVISYQNAFVDIRILVNGVECKRIKPSFRIKRFKDVIVSLKQMKPGDIITEEMLSIEEREITNISGYMEKKEALVGKEAERRIQEGSIILSHYIKEKPIINFGDIVTIIKNGDGFSVKARGMAISTGYSGKKISLRNLSSNKIIEGIAIDKETVEVR